MSRGARWSLIGLCVLLALVGLAQPDRSPQFTPTTYGATPVGYGALYELLSRLELPVSRTFAAPGALPAEATVWWLRAADLCRAGAGDQRTPAPPWTGDAWLASGGTAVVFLGGQTAEECATIAGLAVPPLRQPTPATNSTETVDQTVDGALTPAPRILPLPRLASFENAGDAQVLAQIDGQPFVLSRAVGTGRLLLVADNRPLRNQYLDKGDAAPFALDLVRAAGVPRFDERDSGLHRERDALRYLVRSPALPALLGITLLGALAVWHGNLWPPRRADHERPPAPTLGAFVDSLAQLYARTGDYATVAERYRQLTATRLLRHFALPAETPLPTLLDRLRASRRASPDALAPLAAPATAASPEQLDTLVRALDGLVASVTR